VTTFTEAFKTAAVAPSSQEIVIESLEFYHSSWSGPIRICSLVNGATLTLEATAPRNPNSAQFFDGLNFKFARPTKGDRGGQSVTITMPNVARTTSSLIKDAVNAGGKIDCIWRTYLYSNLTVPQINPPPSFEIFRGTITPFDIRLDSMFFNYLNKPVISVYYSDVTAPGLAR
jgi:hypothetical protein